MFYIYYQDVYTTVALQKGEKAPLFKGGWGDQEGVNATNSKRIAL